LIHRLQLEIKHKIEENKQLEKEILKVNKIMSATYNERMVVKSLNQEIER